MSVRNGLGIVALEQGEHEAALEYFRQSHDFFAAAGDTRGLLYVHINRGVTLWALGRYAEARNDHRAALAAAERIGDVRGVITSLGNLAEVAFCEGDDTTAAELWAQCLRRDRELDYPWGIAASLAHLGDVARRQGDYPGAISLYRDCLRIAQQMGEKRLMTHGLEGLAITRAMETGNAASLRNGVSFLSAAAALREAMRMPVPIPYRDQVSVTADRLRQWLGAATFSALWEASASLDLETVLETALLSD